MREAAFDVLVALQRAGYEAYWVGGCVRDALLGRTPQDYDVATNALPGQVEALFARTELVGKAFGVVRVALGGHWTEVATFRSDGPYRDARRPEEVRFGGVEQDAARRDFTINALYFDPVRNEVFDWVGGRADLEARRLRAVGDPVLRFHEDALRLLRAVRFAARDALEIEPRTSAAIGEEAARVRLVAGERVRDELVAMLTGPNARRALELLESHGLLRELIPELLPLRGCEQSPQYHPEGDVWEHTLRLFEHMRDTDEVLAFGALFHDIGKPETRTVDARGLHFFGHEHVGQRIALQVLTRLRASLRTQEAVRMLIAQHLRFLDVQHMRKSTLRRFVLQEDFATLLELHRLDVMAANGNLSAHDFCRDELGRLASAPQPMRPLLSGHDLIGRGYEAGPGLGEILRALVDAQLEDEVRTPEEAERWLMHTYPRARQEGRNA